MPAGFCWKSTGYWWNEANYRTGPILANPNLVFEGPLFGCRNKLYQMKKILSISQVVYAYEVNGSRHEITATGEGYYDEKASKVWMELDCSLDHGNHSRRDKKGREQWLPPAKKVVEIVWQQSPLSIAEQLFKTWQREVCRCTLDRFWKKMAA